MSWSELHNCKAAQYRLLNACVPRCLVEGELRDAVPLADGLVLLNLTIADGQVTQLGAGPDVSLETHSSVTIDLEGAMVWPCFVDMHTHLDKGHIWPRKRNIDGTRQGAIAATAADRAANWSATDVRARMDFSLRCAYAHGTCAIRTHIDSSAPQHLITWPVLAEMRSMWADRVRLQGVCLEPLPGYADAAFAEELADLMVEYGGILGAVLNVQEHTDELLDVVVGLAIDNGLELDFHVDESGSPESCSFDAICHALVRNGYNGQVSFGHCCSLSVRPEAEILAALDLARELELNVIALPMCNSFLQDRSSGRTPRWRGVTLMQELAQAGISISAASDNTRDPFFAYGDLDMLEVFSQAVRIAQLEYPIDQWPRAVCSNPAKAMGLSDTGLIKVGAAANLVAFNARSYSELLPRPQSDRCVIRNGRVIDDVAPDYRVLDGHY